MEGVEGYFNFVNFDDITVKYKIKSSVLNIRLSPKIMGVVEYSIIVEISTKTKSLSMLKICVKTEVPRMMKNVYCFVNFDSITIK